MLIGQYLDGKYNYKQPSGEEMFRVVRPRRTATIQRTTPASSRAGSDRGLNPVRWQMPAGRIERITNLRRHELERMRAYVSSRDCLMQFLAEELNDPNAGACGKCVNCVGYLLPEEIPEALARDAVEFLDRLENPIQPRKRWPAGMAASEMRGNISVGHQAQEGRALCRWGDPGFGVFVRKGKGQDGHFDDRLVETSARLIENRWRPSPVPAWVTCIPSNRHRTLVPDFARRLGRRLGLPFVECIRKVRDTEPQKTRANSFQQVQNLHGAFAIDRAAVRPAPVLLVDDMVDSKWTFTAAAVLLRQAGSGPVYPFALADSSSENGE